MKHHFFAFVTFCLALWARQPTITQAQEHFSPQEMVYTTLFDDDKDIAKDILGYYLELHVTNRHWFNDTAEPYRELRLIQIRYDDSVSNPAMVKDVLYSTDVGASDDRLEINEQRSFYPEALADLRSRSDRFFKNVMQKRGLTRIPANMTFNDWADEQELITHDTLFSDRLAKPRAPKPSEESSVLGGLFAMTRRVANVADQAINVAGNFVTGENTNMDLPKKFSEYFVEFSETEIRKEFVNGTIFGHLMTGLFAPNLIHDRRKAEALFFALASEHFDDPTIGFDKLFPNNLVDVSDGQLSIDLPGDDIPVQNIDISAFKITEKKITNAYWSAWLNYLTIQNQPEALEQALPTKWSATGVDRLPLVVTDSRSLWSGTHWSTVSNHLNGDEPSTLPVRYIRVNAARRFCREVHGDNADVMSNGQIFYLMQHPYSVMERSESTEDHYPLDWHDEDLSKDGVLEHGFRCTIPEAA